MTEGPGESKAARKRAVAAAKKKAEAAEAVAAPPQPKAAAKPKAKAAASPEAAEPKAKAKAKAKAVAEPVETPAEPKAKAKAKAKGKAAAAPTETAAAPKAAAKSRAATKKKEEDEEPAKKVEDVLVNWVMDDGAGGDWEVKGSKEKKKEDEKKKKKEAHSNQFVGGLAVSNQKMIPGMRLAQDDKAGGAGASQSVAAEIARILAIKGEPVAGEVQKAEGPPDCTAIVDVPERRIGIVIGPAGNTIQMIKAKCGAKNINTDGGHTTVQNDQGVSEPAIRVVITGPREAVSKAEIAVMEIAEKGYCSLAYEDFSENFVMVHPKSFPDLIGKKGAVVQEIKKQLKVEVTFPPVPEGAVKKFKVGLAGDAANVEKAKSTINNILMYGHDEVTHPGMVHAEIEAEQWMYPILIGPKGSSLRNIESVFKIRLFIPRETSMNPNIVLMGEPAGVERAKVSIETRLWSDKEGKKSGDNGDFWGGDEEDIEDWMRPYMYKRR